MKKIFKSNKAKGKTPAPDPAVDAEFALPGYSLKEKDLPKLHKSAWNGDLVKLQQLSKKGEVNQLDKENRLAYPYSSPPHRRPTPIHDQADMTKQTLPIVSSEFCQ